MSIREPDDPPASGDALQRLGGRLLGEIFEEQPDGMLVLDEIGRVVAANSAALAMLGQGEPALRARPAWGVLPGSEPAALAMTVVSLAPGDSVEIGVAGGQHGADRAEFRVALKRLIGEPGYCLLTLRAVARELAAPDTSAEGGYLRDLIEAIPSQVWCAHPDGHLEFQNQRWLEYAGLAAVEAQGWGWREAIHPDDVVAFVQRWFEIMASHRAGEAEARFRRHDGVYRWFMMRVAPVFAADGGILRWCGSNIDIEDRKAAEAALQRSQAYLAQAQSLSRTGSFGWDPASDTVFWSKETFCIHGFDASLLPTLPRALERVHPDDLPLVDASIEAVRQGAEQIDLEYRLKMPTGEIKYVHAIARANADCSAFVGAIMDITAQKLVEQAQRRSHARFQGIVDIAEDAIVSIDAAQRIVLFNQGAAKIFGYAASEVLGQPLDLLIPASAVAQHRADIEAFARSGELARPMGSRRQEIFGCRKNGSIFPAEASISRLLLDDEPVYTVILRDVTERQQLHDHLLASERSARGQAEALAGALGVLAREADPEQVIQHGMRTLTRQLRAKSCSIWLQSEDGLMSFAFALEDNAFKTRSDERFAALYPSLPIDAVWPWPEVFRTRRAFLLDDLRDGEDFPWRAHVLAQGIVSILVVPMLTADAVAGVIGIRFDHLPACSPEDLALAQALANHCMFVIQLSRLMARARLSSAVLERNRIARDLHDTIAQGLTGVIVQLEAAADAAAQGLPAEAEAHAARACSLARNSLKEARRAVHALRPHSLEDRELCEALRHMVEQMTAGTGVGVEYSVVGQPPAMAPEWEQNVLRIAQEAIANAMRHASPKHIRISLSFSRERFELRLRDDGIGFVAGPRGEGFGLQGIAERAAEMGGEAKIESLVGQGTSVYVYLPIDGLLQEGVFP